MYSYIPAKKLTLITICMQRRYGGERWKRYFVKRKLPLNIEAISLSFLRVFPLHLLASYICTCHLTGDAILKKMVGPVECSAQTTSYFVLVFRAHSGPSTDHIDGVGLVNRSILLVIRSEHRFSSEAYPKDGSKLSAKCDPQMQGGNR